MHKSHRPHTGCNHALVPRWAAVSQPPTSGRQPTWRPHRLQGAANTLEAQGHWNAGLLRAAIAMLVLGCCAAVVSAQRIDFETIPGGTPQDGLPISTQFLATHGVEFRLVGGGSPVLAEVGSPTTAFVPNDTPEADQGSFFLTDDGMLNTDSQDLLVLYDTPTASASGVILDIDGSEIFTIEARNAADQVVQTLVIESGDPLTGDQESTPWVLSRPTADITSIRFSGERPGGGRFGLGFDDFSAFGGGTGNCVRTSSVACLLGGRFEVSVTMWDFDGNAFPGIIQTYGGQSSETNQSVSYYSFNEGNVELFVKMVDGCNFTGNPAQGAFWLFVAGATTAEAQILVRDSEKGEVIRVYNPRDQIFATVANTSAFRTCL